MPEGVDIGLGELERLGRPVGGRRSAPDDAGGLDLELGDAELGRVLDERSEGGRALACECRARLRALARGGQGAHVLDDASSAVAAPGGGALRRLAGPVEAEHDVDAGLREELAALLAEGAVRDRGCVRRQPAPRRVRLEPSPGRAHPRQRDGRLAAAVEAE